MHNFNLLDDEWLPVLYREGSFERCSLLRVLRDCDRICEIATSNPMDQAAILRFLIAIMYWCGGSPDEDRRAQLLTEGIPSEWVQKLEDNRKQFDLLGDGPRFYQSPGTARPKPIKTRLKPIKVRVKPIKVGMKSITELFQEVPTGNNFVHFNHVIGDSGRLCLACCTLGLLRLPMFTKEGGKGLSKGINGIPPIYVIEVGATLLQSMHKHWKINRATGAPQWSTADAPSSQAVAEVPLLVGLTALARQVWLGAIEESGRCVGCGRDNVHLVRHCEFEPADLDRRGAWVDPHVIYQPPGSSTKKVKPSPYMAENPLDQTFKKNKKSSIRKNCDDKFQVDKPWVRWFKNLGLNTYDPEGAAGTFNVVGSACKQGLSTDTWARRVDLVEAGQRLVVQNVVIKWTSINDGLPEKLSRPTAEEVDALAYATARMIRPPADTIASADILAPGRTPPVDPLASGREALAHLLSAVAESLEPRISTDGVLRQRAIKAAASTTRPSSPSVEVAPAGKASPKKTNKPNATRVKK